MSSEITVEQYKGKPILKLPVPHGRPWSFGQGKAKLIQKNVEAITKFIQGEDFPQNMEVRLEDFDGQEVIALYKGPKDEYPFSFGRTKAQVAITYLEVIDHFADHGTLPDDVQEQVNQKRDEARDQVLGYLMKLPNEELLAIMNEVIRARKG